MIKTINYIWLCPLIPKIEDMKGKIRVFCRVRPVNESERRRGGPLAATIEDHYSLQVTTQRGTKSFVFDRVFQPHETQDTVFQDTNVSTTHAL